MKCHWAVCCLSYKKNTCTNVAVILYIHEVIVGYITNRASCCQGKQNNQRNRLGKVGMTSDKQMAMDLL